MKFVSCTYRQHAGTILDIFNDAIVNSTALYDYKQRTLDNMSEWFVTKAARDFPVIGAEDEHGQLLGFATYGKFRDRPAYKYSIEHSVYVHKDHRRKGVGRALLQQLLAAASEQNYHVMVGGIDINNQASVALHEKLGFVHAGTIKQAGFKFGGWLDLGLYQLILNTPSHPVDG